MPIDKLKAWNYLMKFYSCFASSDRVKLMKMMTLVVALPCEKTHKTMTIFRCLEMRKILIRWKFDILLQRFKIKLYTNCQQMQHGARFCLYIFWCMYLAIYCSIWKIILFGQSSCLDVVFVFVFCLNFIQWFKNDWIKSKGMERKKNKQSAEDKLYLTSQC